MEKARIYRESEIKIMAEGGRRLSKIFCCLKKEVRVGQRTEEVIKIADKLFKESGDVPSFKGYQGYKDSICISINEEVVHTGGSNRVLQNGDIVSLDLGLYFKGYHTDMAATIPLGNVSERSLKLIGTTREALDRAIELVTDGVKIELIGDKIEQIARDGGFFAVEFLTGHGIGKILHEPPTIYNFKKEHQGSLKEGMVIAIEPIINQISSEVVFKENGSVITKDGGRSAHFEQTMAVTKTGSRVLTFFK